MKRRNELLALLTSLAALVLLTVGLTRLLTPKQHDTGATWGQFLEEPEDSMDVLFFGSSLVYCDVVPAVVWEETGLASYVMAGPEQPIPMSYYYLREALETQSPQAVFVEITGMFYDRYTDYTKTNIGQMPWGANRLEATREEAEPEVRAGLLFPLLFYHDRWQDLTADDWEVAFTGYDQDPLAGYTFLDTYCKPEGIKDRIFPEDAGNLQRNWEYLGKIHDLCLEQGILPIFYVAPTLERIPETLLAPLEAEIRSLDGAVYLNCNDHFAAIGADEARDFYDPLHYNAAGAAKFSRFLGNWMEAELDLTPAGQRDAGLWQGRLDHFRSQLEVQPMKAQAD